MKLDAARRLIATALNAELLEALITFPADNVSQRGYLAAIANMLVGNRDIGRDCRSVVAKYIVHHPATHSNILLIGDEHNAPTHCLLADANTGQRLADAYNGEIKGHYYEYETLSGEQIKDKILAYVPVREVMKHIAENSFMQWLNQYPN